MKRRIFTVLALLASGVIVKAQTPVTVTATITDPNGLAYSFATVQAQLLPSTASPTVNINGVTTIASGLLNGGTDINGTFNMPLFCNVAGNGCTVLSPSGTSWQFTICEAAIQPPIGTGSQCLTQVFTISGVNGLSQTLTFVGIPALTHFGTGSPTGARGAVQESNGSGGFQSGAITDAAGVVNINADEQHKGPNPYVDLRCCGARAVSGGGPSTTATISNGSFTVSLPGGASTFINGDGFRVDGAGASISMSTPAAPTITPKIAAGPMGTGEVTNSPTGSTTYSYQCVAADSADGFTAASPTGSTTVGLASLGDSGAISISSISRSGTTVTVNTSGATNIVAAAAVWIQGVNDKSFNGAFKVASAPSNTQFTYTSGVSTANGGSTASSGGTVDYYLANEVACPAISGSIWKYYVYLNGTLIGQTKPQENIYDDWGATARGTAVFPGNIPSSAPASPQNDPLVTTIVSGAGTTSLTLANAASNSVTTGRAVFDDGPGLLAAFSFAGSTPVFLPNTAPGTSFVLNSFTNLGGGSTTLLQAGGFLLNETLQAGTGFTWKDTLAGNAKVVPSFALTGMVRVSIGTAYPGVYLAGNGITLEGLYFSDPADQALAVLLDGTGGGFGMTFNRLGFTTGNDSNNEDYLGIGFENRGVFGIKLENTLVVPSMSNHGPTGLWAPEIYSRGGVTCCNTGSQFTMKTTSLTAKGFVYEHTWANSSMAVFIDWWYSQGPRSPMVSLAQGNFGPIGGQLSIRNSTIDTSTAPTLTNYNTFLVPILENVAGPAGGALNVTGNAFSGLVSVNSALGGYNTGVVAVPAFTDANISAIGAGTFTYDFSPSSIPAPTLVLAAGGSISIATHTFAVQFIDINGNVSPVGPTSSINVTSGNQTVQISLPSFPQGLVSWFPVIDGNSSSPPPHDTNQCTSIAPTATWNANNGGFLCNTGLGNNPSSAAGPTSISSLGLNAAKLNMVNNGRTGTTNFLSRIAATLSPASVAANSCAAQSFTVTGVISGDILVAVNKPTEQAGLSVTPGHVTGANTATLNFCNNTASPITPTASESYSFEVVQ